MTFIERALRLAEMRGIPQSRLADAAGVERPRIPRWKAGKGVISLPQAIGIARALGVSLDYLAMGEMGTSVPPQLPESAASEDDRLILALIKALDLTTGEALRRLATAPIPSPVQVMGERTQTLRSNHQLPSGEHGTDPQAAPNGGRK